ncbi:MAG: response regulator [Anaerolineae bacterium]|nr:response regulator [Anaerolineae bacterium]
MATILVVDDNLVVQRVVELTLRKAGYDVTTLSQPREVLRVLAENSYDLVIMDINMPEMDGISLLSAIRQQDNGEKIPVIMFTASSWDDDRRRAESAGADAYITKPISSRDLCDIVEETLAQAAAKEDSAS